jgi:hypothetical protein
MTDLLKDFFDRKDCRFTVQCIENGFDQENVCTTFD